MTFAYNIDFDIAGVIFVSVLLIYLMIQFPNKNAQNTFFRWVTCALLLAELTDIFAAYTIAHAHSVPVWINDALNTIYFLTGNVLSYLFFYYITEFVLQNKGKAYFKKPGLFFFTITESCIIANIPGKFLFYMNDKLEYTHGRLYYATYACTLFLIILSGVNILLNIKKLNIKTFISSMSYVVIITSGAIIQAIFFPDIALYLFCASIALLIIFFSLETPDYKKLNIATTELIESKKVAEELYNKATEANQAKSEFISHMSHEIRTPLNAITGLNEMIIRESTDDHIRNYALDVKGATETLYSIVNDILDFSKIESGKLEIIPVPYYFETLIIDIKNIIAELCSRKGLELIFEIDPNIPSKLLGDEIRIKQILINLLTNAVKYTKSGSVTLRIKCNIVTEKVILDFAVIDTGIGISEYDIQRLFQPFERLELVKNRNIEGAGLGLTITRQLVSKMDSDIKVKSVVNEGSSFSFELEQSILDFEPVGSREWLSHHAEATTEFQTSLYAPDARILVVDDNTLNRKVVASLLKESQMTIDEASDGLECIDMVRKNKYDLIFLDHMMPKLDGVETLHKLHDEELCVDTPIIALTANAVSGMREYYLKEGFQDFLTKPVFSHNLEKAAHTWLNPALKKEVPLSDKLRNTASVSVSQDNTSLDNKTDDEKKTNHKLPDIEGILWDYALLFLPENILLPTAYDYYKSLPDVLKKLEELAGMTDDSEALLQYQTTVHSLKSTSAMVGATQLSVLAKTLEHSAKNKQYERIAALNPVLLEEIGLLYKRMEVLESAPGNKTFSSREKKLSSIKDKLIELKESLNEYDYDTADEIIADISANKYDSSQEKIDLLNDQIKNLMSAAAITNIDEILEDLQ